MECLNEYFGYDRNVLAIKQDTPLNLAVRNPMIDHRFHPYEKLHYSYGQNQEYFHTPSNLTVSRRSVGSPSCTSDSEGSISSSCHERLSGSPIDIVTVSNNNNPITNRTEETTKFDIADPNTLETDYQRFREEHLAKLTPKSVSNQNMKRSTQSVQQSEDPTYREKREKNNLAAKKSRDARKQREDEMVVRCAFLESELMKSSLLRKQDKVSVEEEATKLRELESMISQQLESIDEFQKMIFQLKSNNNNSHSSLSI